MALQTSNLSTGTQTSTPVTAKPLFPTTPQTPTVDWGKLNLASPTTAVKSVSTGADGSQTVEYHKPNAQPTSSALVKDASGNWYNPGSNLTPAGSQLGNPPATGNVTTPSGAVVNASTGQPVSTPTTQPPSFPGLVSSLVNTGIGNTNIGQQAQDIASKYGPLFKALSPQMNAVGGYLTTGTTPVAEGRAAAALQAGQAEAGILSQAQQAEMAGIQPQLTAQAQRQAALGTAIGAAQPSGTFPFVFNPLTGSFSTPGGGTSGGGPSLSYNPSQDAQTLAQAVMNKQISYNDALNALGYAGSVSTGLLSTAVLALGGNPTNLQAQAAGSAAVLGGVPQLQSANTAAEGIQKTINNFLDQNPNLNPSDLALSNSVQQWLQGVQITDPTYQTLFNYLSEYTNTLAPILGVGGSPTNLKTEIAQSFLNPKASSSSIKAVITNMQQLASDKVQNIASGASGGGVVAGGTSPGTTPTGGLYDF